MLVKIHPEQFEQGWNAFAPLIQDALPPQVSIRERALINILRAVLMERATPWVEVDEETGDSRAFVLTTIDQEPIMHEKRLLIYILTVFGDPGDIGEWKDSLDTLRKHGRAKDCTQMITYAYDEDYARYLSMLGADTDTVLAQFNL